MFKSKSFRLLLLLLLLVVVAETGLIEMVYFTEGKMILSGTKALNHYKFWADYFLDLFHYISYLFFFVRSKIVKGNHRSTLKPTGFFQNTIYSVISITILEDIVNNDDKSNYDNWEHLNFIDRVVLWFWAGIPKNF